MGERIDEIVSKEAIEELIALDKTLKGINETMAEAVTKSVLLKTSLSRASSAKELMQVFERLAHSNAELQQNVGKAVHGTRAFTEAIGKVEEKTTRAQVSAEVAFESIVKRSEAAKASTEGVANGMEQTREKATELAAGMEQVQSSIGKAQEQAFLADGKSKDELVQMLGELKQKKEEYESVRDSMEKKYHGVISRMSNEDLDAWQGARDAMDGVSQQIQKVEQAVRSYEAKEKEAMSVQQEQVRKSEDIRIANQNIGTSYEELNKRLDEYKAKRDEINKERSAVKLEQAENVKTYSTGTSDGKREAEEKLGENYERLKELTVEYGRLNEKIVETNRIIEAKRSVETQTGEEAVRIAQLQAQAEANVTQKTRESVSADDEKLARKKQLEEAEARWSAAIGERTEQESKAEATISRGMDALEQWVSSAKMSSQSLADVEVKIREAQQGLKTAMSSGDTSGIAQYKEELSMLKAEQKTLNVEVENSVKQNNAEFNSMEEKQAMLLRLKNAYRQLSEEEKNSKDVGVAMVSASQELARQIKTEKRSIDGNALSWRTRILEVRRTMMTSMEASSSMKIEMQSLAAEAKLMAQQRGIESNEYKELQERIRAMNDAYGENKTKLEQARDELERLTKIQKISTAETSAMVQVHGGIKSVTMGIGTMAAGYRVAVSAMALYGGESEKLKNALAKVLLVQQAMTALQTVVNNLSKTSLMRIRTRVAWEKIRKAYTEAVAVATKKEAAATAASTAATTANTAAQKANTAAKAEAAAGTAAVATVEKGATSATVSFSTALKGVGAALKQVPLIGWAVAAATAIGTVVAVLVKMRKEENEKEAEPMRERLKTAQDLREGYTSALSSTMKVNAELDRNVEKLKQCKEGSMEWDRHVKNVADALGVSDEWLRKNLDKVDGLAEAWKRVKMSMALSDNYLQKYTENAVKANELDRIAGEALNVAYADRKEYNKKLKETYNLTDDEIKKVGILQKSYVKASEKTIWYRKTLNDGTITFTTAQTKLANEISSEQVSKFEVLEYEMQKVLGRAKKRYEDAASVMMEESEKAAREIKGDMDELTEAQKQSENESAESTRGAVTERTRELERLRSHYEELLQQIDTLKEAQGGVQYKIDLAKLEKWKSKESEIIRNGEKEKLLSAEEGEKMRSALEVLYGLKREEIEKKEQERRLNVIASANKETFKILQDLETQRIKNSGKTNEEMTELLLKQEEKRWDEQKKLDEEAQNAELKTEEEGSDAYLAIKRKYAAKEEQEEYTHQQNLNKIKNDGWQATLKEIENRYKELQNDRTISTKGRGASELETLEMSAEMAREEQEAFEKMVKSRIENAGSLQKALEELGMTEEEYNQKQKEMQASALAADIAVMEKRQALQWELASSIGGAVAAIGNALAAGTEDEVKQVQIQQGVAMAQVLLAQAQAIAEATKAAAKGDTYTAAIRIATAVGAVVAQIVTAKNSIRQARASLSEASAYAEGTDWHKGGQAVVGEGKAPELVIAGGRQFVVDKPTLIRDLPVGSKVIPLKEGGEKAGVDLTDVLKGMEELKNRSSVKINVGENVYAYIVKGASRTRILNRQFSH